MKKVISLLLVCMMMLTMVTAVSAADKVTVTVADVDATECATSDNIVIPVTIDKVPEGQARIFSFIISYDPTKVKFVQSYFYEDETEEVMAMPAYKPASGKVNRYPIEPTTTSATTANAQGWLKVEYSDSGTNVISAESIAKTNVFTYLWFTKVEGAKGTADLTITDVEIVDQATDSAGVAYTLSTTPDYIGLEHGTITLSTVTKYDITHTQGTGYTTNLDTIVGEKVKAEGEAVDFTVTPDAGYQIDSVKMNGADVSVNEGIYSFTMPNTTANVVVTASKIKYALSKAAATNGTVTLTPAEGDVEWGTTVSVTATPDAGYKVSAIKVNGAAIEGTTFEMPEANAEVAVEFELIPPTEYTITAGACENGAVSVVPTSGYAGDTVTVTAIPETGYELDEVYVNESPIEGTTFTIADANVIVTATFKKVDYAITTSEVSNFNISNLGATAQYGDEIVFIVSPAIGYEVEVTSDDAVIAKNDTAYSFTMPAKPVAINIVASLIDYTITTQADENAQITAPATANYGDAVEFTAAAFTGFIIDEVTVNDEVITGTEGVYSFTMPEGDVVIKATTKIDPFMDTRIASITVNNQNATINVTDATVALNVYAQTATINVVTVEENATVEINGTVGKTVTEDVYVGDTTFAVVVTAEDGVTTETYTLKVTTPAQSTGRPSSAATGGSTGTTLADVKNNVSAKLDSATENLNKDDYSEEAWAEIEKLIEDAKADLENAKNVKAAEKIEEELLEAIEAVKTIDEEEPAEDVEIPVDETLEAATIPAPEKTEEEIAAAEALYSDMDDHWALAYVHELSVVNNVFKGNEDGTFAPDIGITRQEIAVALGRLLGLEEIAAEVTATDFTDDAEIADWAKGYVAVMNELGLLKGYADGSFGPNDVITREQLALILSRMVEAPEAVAGMAFDDVDSISDWAAEGCAIAYTYGIIKGYPDNTFKGANTVTRAEAVVMIYNYITAIAD